MTGSIETGLERSWNRVGDWLRGRCCAIAAYLDGLSERSRRLLILAGSLLVALPLVAVTLLPWDRAFTYNFALDLMIFYDGAHRVLAGQLPNVDFHTPLGLLAYLLPALGLWLTGSAGGMILVAHAVFGLVLLPLVIRVCVTRLPPVYAAMAALFTFTLVLTPISIGEQLPSFAMFYNRWGYALLGILFLLTLPRLPGNRGATGDAITATAVLLLTFYLKLSYFAVALAFVVGLLLLRHTRRSALAAFAGTLLGIVVVHLFWGGTAGYLADLRSAADASGVVRSSVLGLAAAGLFNIGMLFPFLLVVGLAVFRGVPPITLILCIYMAAAGLLLADQNFQGVGLLTIVPSMMVLALAGRDETPTAQPGLRLASTLIVAAIVLPLVVLNGVGIFQQSWMAIRGGSHSEEYVAEVDGLITQEVPLPAPGMKGLADARSGYRSAAFDLQTVAMIRANRVRQILAQPEYFWTLHDAAALLRSDPRLEGPIFNFDMANPLNALTDRGAPRGIDSWYHVNRTFGATSFRDPATLFSDVAVVMVPKAPVSPEASAMLRRIYGDHLTRHYALVRTSDYWWAYVRKGAGPIAR